MEQLAQQLLRAQAAGFVVEETARRFALQLPGIAFLSLTVGGIDGLTCTSNLAWEGHLAVSKPVRHTSVAAATCRTEERICYDLPLHSESQLLHEVHLAAQTTGCTSVLCTSIATAESRLANTSVLSGPIREGWLTVGRGCCAALGESEFAERVEDLACCLAPLLLAAKGPVVQHLVQLCPPAGRFSPQHGGSSPSGDRGTNKGHQASSELASTSGCHMRVEQHAGQHSTSIRQNSAGGGRQQLSQQAEAQPPTQLPAQQPQECNRLEGTGASGSDQRPAHQQQECNRLEGTGASGCDQRPAQPRQLVAEHLQQECNRPERPGASASEQSALGAEREMQQVTQRALHPGCGSGQQLSSHEPGFGPQQSQQPLAETVPTAAPAPRADAPVSWSGSAPGQLHQAPASSRNAALPVEAHSRVAEQELPPSGRCPGSGAAPWATPVQHSGSIDREMQAARRVLIDAHRRNVEALGAAVHGQRHVTRSTGAMGNRLAAGHLKRLPSNVGDLTMEDWLELVGGDDGGMRQSPVLMTFCNPTTEAKYVRWQAAHQCKVDVVGSAVLFVHYVMGDMRYGLTRQTAGLWCAGYAIILAPMIVLALSSSWYLRHREAVIIATLIALTLFNVLYALPLGKLVILADPPIQPESMAWALYVARYTGAQTLLLLPTLLMVRFKTFLGVQCINLLVVASQVAYVFPPVGNTEPLPRDTWAAVTALQLLCGFGLPGAVLRFTERRFRRMFARRSHIG